ncbi:hypothetical protein QLL94_gp23 [Pectobacterium phage PP2]|uniref:Uncharacterized protein n=1 Tax=Pectobacterium phage PP2 TaxID=1897743 RepID=A0A1W5P509_9CAUD|nr:hypothetical protein QLL94_gp23 [Pectobacterium phage PP2]AOT25389.1 hypothetical protein PP2_023 [Pectobacterium phage PP2]
MRNTIDVNPKVRVFLAAELGDIIARGLFKQVGQLRTEYVRAGEGHSVVLGRQSEAIIYDTHLDTLYAVESYKGLAIRSEIADVEMLDAIRSFMGTLEEGEGFVYDQRVTLGQEELGDSYVSVPKGVEVNDGTDPDA